MTTRRGKTLSSGEPGWFGYLVADADRTANALRLARWVVPAFLVALALVVGAVAMIAVTAPAALLGCATTATAAGIAVRSRRRRH